MGRFVRLHVRKSAERADANDGLIFPFEGTLARRSCAKLSPKSVITFALAAVEFWPCGLGCEVRSGPMGALGLLSVMGVHATSVLARMLSVIDQKRTALVLMCTLP